MAVTARMGILGQAVLNAALMAMGVIDQPLEIMFTENAVLIGIVAVNLPFMVLSLQSVIEGIDRAVEEAAFSLGAPPLTMFRRVLWPLALPGIMTGTILGLARAFGETAPLLMIGMVAFIVDVPSHLLDPATVLPVQIYLWADSPERAFVERTAAATLVLAFASGSVTTSTRELTISALSCWGA